jgi:uncharacterized protein YjiS (DUF1127 family)
MHQMHGSPDFSALHKLSDNPYVQAIERAKKGGAQGAAAKTMERAMNLKKSYSAWRKYRQTVNELNRMSDRELADLGIGRGEIASVARHSAN